jgi:hypothetical protein
LLGSISTLQQLDLSSNNIGADGATHVADAMKDNGALTQLDVSSNDLAGKTWNGMTDAYQHRYDYDFSGIQTLADALPKCQ